MSTKAFSANAVNLFIGTPADGLVGSMTVLMKTNKYYTDGTLLKTGVTYAVTKDWGRMAVDKAWADDSAKILPEENPPNLDGATLSNLVAKSNKINMAQALTKAGTYVGTGAAQSINVGWRPDFVVIKSSAAVAAVIQTNLAWHRRGDALINVESIGDASTPTGADTGGGVTLTETGFDVGGNSRVNGAAATIYWWAYRDQGSGSFLQASYQGNALSGRTVELFEGRQLAMAFVKRDFTPGPVWMAPGKVAFHWTGAAMAVSTDTGLSADGKIVVTGSGNEINGWSGALGEAMGFYGVPADSEAATAFVYTGNGATRRISLPWEPECFLVMPLTTAVATAGRLWIAGMAAGASAPVAAGAVAVDSNIVTVVQENTVVFGTNASVNENTRLYLMVAFKKANLAAYVDTSQRSVIHRKAVQCPTGGYIDCGTDDSLNVQLPRTLEFYGSAQPPTTAQTPMVGGPGVDSEAGKQAPIMFRSNGNDATASAISYGFELCAPTAHDSSGLSRGPTILVARRDVWTLPQDGLMPNLDPYPMNTGFVPPIQGRAVGHYLVTEEIDGTIRVYFDGVMVKESKRDLRATYGHNGKSYPGHRLIFGGRRGATTVSNTNGHSFRMARIYNRALTPDEVRKNFLALTGDTQAVGGYVEMWDATDSDGTTVPAKINPANNGTIVSSVLNG
jgi:hypothetical protein